MDEIKIKDLELYCHHGVYSEEERLGQRFVISVEMYMDTREAGKADDLEKSVNYGEVCHFIKEFMENHTYKLIESVAERLTEEILVKWTDLEGVKLEIKKPWAPVGLPLDTVAVEIKRQWHTAYIAIGSNLGDRCAYLQKAIKTLEDCHDCQVIKVSELISTKPYGMTEQDEFLNGALMLRTLKTPQELLTQFKEIEAAAGRGRGIRWGPRTLDLDIIFYDDMIIDTEELHIPHIDMQNRGFVLGPLEQITPYKRHPILKKTVKELRGELNGRKLLNMKICKEEENESED